MTGSEVDIKNMAAPVADEVPVFFEVWAIPGRFAVHVNLFHQPACDEGFQGIVNSRQRDRWHRLFCPDEDLRGSRVIPTFEQLVIHVPPLRGIAQVAVADCRFVIIRCIACEFHCLGMLEGVDLQ